MGYTQRPWSPANSNSGLSQSGLLSPGGLNSYRSLSPSPSRSPSRYRSRPWCPSVSVTSPGIPGIPQSLSAAATYIPRPVSSVGQNRGESPAPANGSRSAASTPSMMKAPNQFKPVFSPAGSISKLSTGIHSTLSSPATTTTTTGARKTGLPLPSSRPPSQQRSNMSPSPQLQRPQSRGYGREAASPVPNNYASSTTSSNRLSTSSVSSLTTGRQRQFSSNNTNVQGYHGYGAQEGRASPGTAYLTSRQSQHGQYDDRAYSRPGSASGSTSSLGRDPYHHYQSYEEPTSPSASSSSSITSASRFHQQHYGRDQHELGERMEKMKIHIEDIKPYVAIRGDELDEEFGRVLNANPIQMQVHRLGEGKYYFGGRIEDQSLVGGKLYLCRLMEYGRSGEEDSGVSSGGSHSGTDDGLHPSSGARSRSQAGRHNPSGLATIYSAGSLAGLQAEENTRRDNKKRPRKVLVRVGGGWQDLDIFLLDHSSLANDNVVVRSY